MSESAAHLHLISNNDGAHRQQEVARQFRETMAEHIRAHTEGTNVNSKTLLATDYLNHFNEAIMLLEMLPTAPAELAADLAGWRYESYEEHFHESGFRDKALAIAGYKHCPPDIRTAFDAVADDLSGQLGRLLKEVQTKVEANDIEAVSLLCMDAVPELQSKLEMASAIINGEVGPAGDSGNAPTDAGAHQAAIDELFDD